MPTDWAITETSAEMDAVGQYPECRHRLTHRVRRINSIGVVGLAAMLLTEGPLAGHVATAVESRGFALSASSGNAGPGLTRFPDGSPRLGRTEAEWPARDEVSGPSAKLVACAADITSAGSTIDYWTTALKDKDPHVRSQAARALGETRVAAAVPALIEALKDEDEEVRLLVVQALGWIGREARAAVPALMKTLKDTRPNISAEAARTLEKIRQPQ